MPMTRRTIVAITLVAAVVTALGCGGRREPAPATVAGDEIERADVESLMALYARRAEAEGEGEEGKGEKVSHAQEVATLQTLVQRAIIEHKARELGVTVNEQRVEQRADTLRGRGETDRDPDAGEEGELGDQVRATARAQLLSEAVERTVTRDASVSDGEVLAYYRDHPSLYATDGKAPPARPAARVRAAIRRGLVAAKRGELMRRWLDGVRREFASKVEYARGWDPRSVRP
jgi:hypothetical protein